MNAWRQSTGLLFPRPAALRYHLLDKRERKRIRWMTVREVCATHGLQWKAGQRWKAASKKEFGE